ncbi:hypothetical protein HYC85_030145 [Camellia sinensis]|uniref:Uncharacterized protein n=1 Tax=Camellia sinensis TaxID=4442 RepID=A0A7J7G3Q3_CAMSI|nr:hypothetical protein HYC85_030145 [Camellia sinensis]
MNTLEEGAKTDPKISEEYEGYLATRVRDAKIEDRRTGEHYRTKTDRLSEP